MIDIELLEYFWKSNLDELTTSMNKYNLPNKRESKRRIFSFANGFRKVYIKSKQKSRAFVKKIFLSMKSKDMINTFYTPAVKGAIKWDFYFFIIIFFSFFSGLFSSPCNVRTGTGNFFFSCWAYASAAVCSKLGFERNLEMCVKLLRNFLLTLYKKKIEFICC